MGRPESICNNDNYRTDSPSQGAIGPVAVTCLAIGYTVGAIAAWRALRGRILCAPFQEVSGQLDRDRQRLQSGFTSTACFH